MCSESCFCFAGGQLLSIFDFFLRLLSFRFLMRMENEMPACFSMTCEIVLREPDFCASSSFLIPYFIFKHVFCILILLLFYFVF